MATDEGKNPSTKRPSSLLEPKPPPDYLLLGHVSKDFFHGEMRTGGTVLYATVAATRLGRRVGVVTAYPDRPFPADLATAAIVSAPSQAATVLEHFLTPKGRRLYIRERAAAIEPEHVPLAWRSTPLVHLAPIAQEVAPAMVECFPTSQIVATFQGWLRSWNALGLVRVGRNRDLDAILARVSAAVVSVEDVGGDITYVERIAQRVPALVLTQGARGYALYVNARPKHFAAVPAREVDATGAGDVFAAAFFIRFSETADPVASARFAAAAAALAVEGVGPTRIPNRAEVEARLRDL